MNSKAASRRIGLFGGSFDPPHLAHRALADLALAHLELDELRWLPAGQPWQKAGRRLADRADRVGMLRLIMAGEPRFVLDERELDRQGATYTIDTVRELSAEYPDAALLLVIGQDQYERFDTWRDWRELLERVTLAVASRGDAAPTAPIALKAVPHHVVALPLPEMPLSSTAVRAAAAQGFRVDFLVGPPVAGYIADHHLYKESVTHGMDIRKLQRAIVDGLEDVKAQHIVVFNTEALSPLFERVIIASGTSNRQTKSLAASVRETVKARGLEVLRTEGEENGEWIIVDCGAAVAHIMQPSIRDYYHLEEIWGGKPVHMKRAEAAPRGLPKASEEPAPAASSRARSTAAKSGAAQPAVTKSGTRKAAAKKAPVKVAVSKKASVKTTAVKRAPVKVTAARQAPVEVVVAKKVSARTAAAKKSVPGTAVPRTAARKAPAKKPAARPSPAQKAATPQPARKAAARPSAKSAKSTKSAGTTAARAPRQRG